MRYYEIATDNSVQELDEDLKSKLKKLANLGAAAGTAATLGYGAGVATHPSRDIQQTPASIAHELQGGADEPAGYTTDKPRADKTTDTAQTPSADTVRPKPRPDDLTTADPELSKLHPKKRPQSVVVTGLANADADYKVNNVSNNKDIENLLIKTATAAGITGTELQAFLAQAYHESRNFTSTIEQRYGDNKNYFKHAYDIRYNPVAAAKLGNIKPGDGEKFKGRGYLQVTGRFNYAKAAKALGLPLLEHPELLEDPKVAAAVSVWFWKWRVRARSSGDWSNVQEITNIVNGGKTAVDDRGELFNAYGHLKALKHEIKRPD